MDEHAEDPVGQAGQKVVQYASLATMAAEAIAQVRQQRAAAADANDARTAAEVRAQRTAALTAARAQWQPVLESRLRGRTSLADAGVAWAAAQGWREVDPQAALASDRALERLRELRPDVMMRFDRLTDDGLDPIEAMRRVAPFFDRPAARPGEHAPRAAVERASVDVPDKTRHAPVAAIELDTRSSVTRQHYIDTGQYLPTAGSVREADVGWTTSDGAGRTPGSERGNHAEKTTATDDPGTLQAKERAGPTALAGTGTCPRTAADLAKDGFPEPLTAEVLAAGRVRPKAPTTTAPAAVRSAGLATAARAASRTR